MGRDRLDGRSGVMFADSGSSAVRSITDDGFVGCGGWGASMMVGGCGSAAISSGGFSSAMIR